MSDKFKYDLYKISWEDICSDSGWASDAEFDRMERKSLYFNWFYL